MCLHLRNKEAWLLARSLSLRSPTESRARMAISYFDTIYHQWHFWRNVNCLSSRLKTAKASHVRITAIQRASELSCCKMNIKDWGVDKCFAQAGFPDQEKSIDFLWAWRQCHISGSLGFGVELESQISGAGIQVKYQVSGDGIWDKPQVFSVVNSCIALLIAALHYTKVDLHKSPVGV